jgi:hypothetical protein
LENNGYEAPELNDKLYLHFRGFKKIENLGPYTGVKAIWLDSNGFDKIENLTSMEGLRCLYMSKNLISRIEGLETLKHLHTLDLSYNRLTMISGLSHCPALNTVNLSRNSLATPAAIAHLQECLKLTTIDLSNNCLEADEGFFEVFQNIPSMSTLSLNGNEVTRLPHFRKKMIANIPRIGYLDRPVEEIERVGAKAFMEGGADAEVAARDNYRDEQRAKKSQEMQQYREWQQEQRKIREKQIEEGRAKILQFTDEEVAQRAAEAKAAAEAEKQMLEFGIENVAKRYWQLEAGGKGANGLEVLEEATRQIAAERAEDVVVPPPPPTEEELLARAEEEARAKAEAEAQAEIDGRARAEAAAAEAQRKIEEAAALVEKKRLQAEEDERQQRVADSFRIYKAQLEAEKRAKSAQSSGAGAVGRPAAPAKSSIWDSWENNDINVNANTSSNSLVSESSSGFKSWESAAEVLCADNRPQHVFYWSEAMDMRLAQEVRICIFDFEAVAQKLRAASMAGEFRSSGRGRNSDGSNHKAEQFTAEACRIRWSQLSSDQWVDFDAPKRTTTATTTISSTNAENARDQSTNVVEGSTEQFDFSVPESAESTPMLPPAAIYKVCIPSEMLSHGHGGQPTFEQLSKMTNKLPSYLKAPTALPSVQADDDDEDDDDSDGAAPVPISSRVGASFSAYNFAAAVDETKDVDTSYEELD